MTFPLPIEPMDDAIFEDPSHQYVAKLLELDEITRYIMLLQVSARCDVSERLHLPPLRRTVDLDTIVQIDGCLMRLENSPALTNTLDSDRASELGRNQSLFRLR